MEAQLSDNHPSSSGTKIKSARTTPLSLRAAWTDRSRRGHSSAFAELERQRYGMPSEEETGTKYLSWVERQRLVDRPSTPLWPMLVAIGMLCVVSIGLSSSKDDIEGDIRLALQDSIEVPFVPHEWEAMRERGDFIKIPEKAEEQDTEAEQGDALLQRKKDEFFMDEGDKTLDWVERHVTLGSSLLTGADLALLLTQAPDSLMPLIRSIMKQAKELERLSRGSSKLSILLRQDLLSVAQLILLCRVLSIKGNLDRAQRKRLLELKQLVKRRFGEEWPEALSMTRYMGGRKEHEVYGRLVNVVVCAVDTFFNHCIKTSGKLDEDSAENKQKKGAQEDRCPWKITTNRFELQRLLESAKFSPDLAEVFRADKD